MQEPSHIFSMSRTVRDLSHGRTLRHPRTFAEHRDSEACRVDGIKKRITRRRGHLPSNYDDKIIAATYEVVPRKKPNTNEYFMFW